MRAKKLLGDVLAPIAVMCAVISTALFIRREFFVPGPSPVDAQEPLPVQNWSDEVTKGHYWGPESAAVRVLVFSDFQCPFCRDFALDTWTQLQERFQDKVALVVRHFPLQQHAESYPAARAAECAGEQGAFFEAQRALYQNQDSLGRKAYTEIVFEAGLRDTVAFGECMKRPGMVPVIETDIAAARAMGATGTPTVIVEGRLLRRGATMDEIAPLIEEALLDAALKVR